MLWVGKTTLLLLFPVVDTKDTTVKTCLIWVTENIGYISGHDIGIESPESALFPAS